MECTQLGILSDDTEDLPDLFERLSRAPDLAYAWEQWGSPIRAYFDEVSRRVELSDEHFQFDIRDETVAENLRDHGDEVHIHVEGAASIGNLNFGDVLGDLNSHIHALHSDAHGCRELREALRAIGQGVAGDPLLRESEKREVLETLDYLATVAAEDEAERHPGAIRSSLRYLTSVVAGSAALTTLWDVWAGAVLSFFGVMP